MASFENVSIVIKDDTLSSLPVEGVVVRVFDDTGTTFQTSAVTDDDGEIAIVLPAPETYQVRFYKFQVSIAQPLLIEVLEAPTPPLENTFDVAAHVFSPPEAIDPRFCRCSGFFRLPNGAPASGVDIQILPKFKPLLFEDDAMVAERLSIKTDNTGYVEIDLVRFGIYNFQVEGVEICLRTSAIPDQASANLPDIIFPIVGSVELSPAGPYAINVDEEIQITPTVYTSAGVVLDGVAVGDVIWSTSDTSVAVVQAAGNVLTLRGIAAGSTNIVAVRADTSIVQIPDTGISGLPIGVTVT